MLENLPLSRFLSLPLYFSMHFQRIPPSILIVNFDFPVSVFRLSRAITFLLASFLLSVYKFETHEVAGYQKDIGEGRKRMKREYRACSRTSFFTTHIKFRLFIQNYYCILHVRRSGLRGTPPHFLAN